MVHTFCSLRCVDELTAHLEFDFIVVNKKSTKFERLILGCGRVFLWGVHGAFLSVLAFEALFEVFRCNRGPEIVGEHRIRLPT